MKTNHKKKKNIILFCERSMRNEELIADKKSIAIMDKLKEKKKYAYRELDEAQDKIMMI